MLAYRNYFMARSKQRPPDTVELSGPADAFLDKLQAALTAREALELDAVQIGTDFPSLDHLYQNAFDLILDQANTFPKSKNYWESIAYDVGAFIGSYDRKWLREATGIRITPNDVRPTPPLDAEVESIMDFDPNEFGNDLLLWEKQYPNHPLVQAHLVLNADHDQLLARARQYLKPITAYPPGKLGFYNDSELVFNWIAHVRLHLSDDKVAEALPYVEQLFRLGYNGEMVPTILTSLAQEGVQANRTLRKQYPLVAKHLSEMPEENVMDVISELADLLGAPDDNQRIMDILGLPNDRPLGRRKPSAKVRSLKNRQLTKGVYRIKVTLRGSKPPIWRRLELLADTQLEELHAIIQTIFEWTNSHLHNFDTGNRFRESFSSPDDPYGHEYGESYAGVTIAEMFARSGGKKFTYTYDFGDSWEHTILLEKELPIDPKLNYPICVTGRCAAPLDDMGGMWGYYDYLAGLEDPKHEMHEDAVDWLGEDFDHKAFDLQEINQRLEGFR